LIKYLARASVRKRKDRQRRLCSVTNSALTPGIAPARLPANSYIANFDDVQPAFDRHEAQVAEDRCYFCHDAPCITA